MKLLGFQVPFTKAFGAGALVPARQPGFIGWVRESFAGAWQAGVTLDDRQTIMSASPVYACVNRIASDIAKLRPRLVEEQDGIWTLVERNSPYWAVLRKPNHYQNRIQFFVAWVSSKLMFGNTYVLKERDQRGIVTKMHVLDPRRVTPLVAPSGDVYYQLGNDDLAGIGVDKIAVPASEIIHDRGLTMFHPLVGVSPIFACAMAATQRNRIQANSATFFENMSRPSGILSGPGVINEITADRLKKAWEENFTGSKIGRLAVLGDGLNYQAMTINAVDAQLIQQLEWTGEDIARAFAMPAYKINIGPVPTSNNVEALNRQYYDGCLQTPIEAIELCLDEGLGLTVTNTEFPMGVEFDLDGLLRMDSASMFKALGEAVKAGIMAPNEARRRVNLAKTTGGETPYMQQQNWSLGQLAKRDIIEDKPAAAPPPATPAATEEPPEEDDDKTLAVLHKVSFQQGATHEAVLAAVKSLEERMAAWREARPEDDATVRRTLELERLAEANAADMQALTMQVEALVAARAEPDPLDAELEAVIERLMAAETLCG